MRNGVISLPPLPGGTAPAPPSCGLKKRAATLENTKRAENPWKLGTLTRPATAGILELCHSIGKASGVLPQRRTSDAFWVYVQPYSPARSEYRPNAACGHAWKRLP